MQLSACRGRNVTGACSDCKVRLVSVCSALEAEELSELERLAHASCYPARETLFHQGEPADAVYTVTAGTVRLYNLLSDGRRQIVGFALPGDFLGLSPGDTYRFSADAVEPVVACRFARNVYEGLSDRKPHLQRRLLEFATHELTLAREQMALLGRRSAEEKVATFLLGLRERWAVLFGGHESATVQLPMGRQDIADYLGLTIETVSRTLSRLAGTQAVLIVPGGVRLTDLPRLRRLAAI